MSDWQIIATGALSLVGVVVGAVLFGGRLVPPLYFPPIANTEPPTTPDLDDE